MWVLGGVRGLGERKARKSSKKRPYNSFDRLNVSLSPFLLLLLSFSPTPTSSLILSRFLLNRLSGSRRCILPEKARVSFLIPRKTRRIQIQTGDGALPLQIKSLYGREIAVQLVTSVSVPLVPAKAVRVCNRNGNGAVLVLVNNSF